MIVEMMWRRVPPLFSGLPAASPCGWSHHFHPLPPCLAPAEMAAKAADLHSTLHAGGMGVDAPQVRLQMALPAFPSSPVLRPAALCLEGIEGLPHVPPMCPHAHSRHAWPPALPSCLPCPPQPTDLYFRLRVDRCFYVGQLSGGARAEVGAGRGCLASAPLPLCAMCCGPASPACLSC